MTARDRVRATLERARGPEDLGEDLVDELLEALEPRAARAPARDGAAILARVDALVAGGMNIRRAVLRITPAEAELALDELRRRRREAGK